MILSQFKNKKCFLFFVVFIFLLFSFSPPRQYNLSKQDKDKAILKSIYYTLLFFHYHSPEINEKFSEGVYKRYLDIIDPQKLYFLESEISKFSNYRKKLANAFIGGNTNFFDVSITCLRGKISYLEKLIKKILGQPFDFTKKEMIMLGGNNKSYAKNVQEFEDKWRIYLKYTTLIEMTSSKKDSKNKKNENVNLLSEELARKKVLQNIMDYFRQLKMRKKNDLFTIYINAITAQYDPHTMYLSSKDKEDFDFKISGQLEGIGAILQDKKGYSTIVKLIVGGPAWKSKQIEVGDKILKVAQGKYGEYKNILGLLLSDSIRLIRGRKGSIVRLTLQKQDGRIKEISLVRDVVEQKEMFTRSVLLKDKSKNYYGYIYLPEFYFNPKNKNGRNAVNDIQNEIERLKKNNIKGLVLDLRNNGGGSLEAAVNIDGLFIGKGPIVQLRHNNGKKEIISSNINSAFWRGPLIVLVNEYSASASEILAGALQDYQRGLIIGGEQTYGKGTVQTLLPLNNFLFTKSDMGVLKITISKFYRINGSSTQLKGVEPDLVIPGKFSYNKFSEKDQENPMKWDRIEAIPYRLWEHAYKLKNIQERFKKKNCNDVYIKILTKLARSNQILEKDKSIPLQWEKFKIKMEEKEEKNKAFNSLENYTNGLIVKSLTESYPIGISDNNQDKEWMISLKKDIYIGKAIEALRAYH